MNQPHAQPWFPGLESEQRDPSRSQWYTPPQLARRMWAWATQAKPALTVLEPSAGQGALVEAVVRYSVRPRQITTVDIDPANVEVLRKLDGRGTAIDVVQGDFLACPVGDGGCMALRPLHMQRFDLALMNPPFEGGNMTAFIEHALRFADRAVTLAPAAILHSSGRLPFWQRHRIARGVRLASRPRFGGEHSPATDFVVLEVVRDDGRTDAGIERWEWWA